MAENTIATKAETKLAKLCDIAGLSEDGEIWVKQTLDPFNDEERRKVGYPDVITGKSVIQKIPCGGTYTVPAGGEDVHIFMDSLDTPVVMYENTMYTEGGNIRPNNYVCDAAFGAGNVSRRGGIVLGHNAIGSDITEANYMNFGGPSSPVGLSPAFLQNCGSRVIAKGFEVVNVTPQLTVGGAVRTYRATGNVPYDDSDVCCLRSPTLPTTVMNVCEARALQDVPKNVTQVEYYTDYTFWNAKEGCMVVAIPSAQTNEPKQDHFIPTSAISSLTPTKRWVGAFGTGLTVPQASQGGNLSCSPFYACGAYFTGLPEGTKLDVRGFYYLEKFVDANDANLSLLANPSPHYDPLALELMSKTAMKLPTGTRIKNNASGDWLKTVADIAGAFGVPGMPLVRGAVDLYQGARKVYKNYQNNSGNMQGNAQAMALVNNSKLDQKFNTKNQKRTAKGKAAVDRNQFVQKKQAKKQTKKAIKESRAGMASGGSK